MIRVPARTANAEHRVRGSRFLAVAQPASDIERALRVRDAERARYHDATHWVFACRLHDGTWRFDDDGEPSGTGGRPVLAAIESRELSDVVVVVTRYFGGTKLGTGGLARAYGEAAAAVLANLPVQLMVPATHVRIRFPYADTGTVVRLVEGCGGQRLDEAYDEAAELVVAIPSALVPVFVLRVRDDTAGRASARALRVEMLIPGGP